MEISPRKIAEWACARIKFNFLTVMIFLHLKFATDFENSTHWYVIESITCTTIRSQESLSSNCRRGEIEDNGERSDKTAFKLFPKKTSIKGRKANERERGGRRVKNVNREMRILFNQWFTKCAIRFSASSLWQRWTLLRWLYICIFNEIFVWRWLITSFSNL